jgi:hypothetical protein
MKNRELEQADAEISGCRQQAGTMAPHQGREQQGRHLQGHAKGAHGQGALVCEGEGGWNQATGHDQQETGDRTTPGG